MPWVDVYELRYRRRRPRTWPWALGLALTAAGVLGALWALR